MSGIALSKKSVLGHQAVEELLRLAEDHNGRLTPAVIIAAAKRADSPLHGRFTWDNTEAAEKWRYWQARFIISIAVNVVETNDGPRKIRAFVSLKNDRSSRDGYRIMADVLSSDKLRTQMLEESLEQMAYFRQKYATLKELQGVFSVMRKTSERVKKLL